MEYRCVFLSRIKRAYISERGIKLKRIITIIYIFIALCAIVSCTSEESATAPSASPQPADKPTTAAASGQAVTEKEDSHTGQTYIKSTFIDLNGKKQVLDLGWINTKKRAVELQGGELAAEYGQVQNGHYYFLRGDQRGEHLVLYRDKGEKVFAVKCKNTEELIRGAVLHQEELYLLCLDRKLLHEDDVYKYSVKCANLTTGAVDDIFIGAYPDKVWIDEKYIYVYDNDAEYSWSCFDKRTGRRLMEYSFEFKDDDVSLLDMRQMDIEVIDEKAYYMKRASYTSNSYLLIQVNLKNKKMKEIFEYKPILKDDAVVELADINEKGVFVRELEDTESKNQGVWLYQIPFNNGKMSKSKSANKWYSSYYKNHFVYMDEKNRMHHVNLKNNKDTVIVNQFKRGVHSFMCAKEGIFIMYGADWLDSDDDDDSIYVWNNSLSLELYYMDYKGKNRTKLTEEVGLDRLG